MFIVVLYYEDGDFYPMYWGGAWYGDRDQAWQYERYGADRVAEYLESDYEDRCVRVIQVS